MAKAQKETVHLISSAGTGFFYSVRKNKKKLKGDSKMKSTKYDPVVRKHVLFEEKKLSKLKKQKAKQAQKKTEAAETSAS